MNAVELRVKLAAGKLKLVAKQGKKSQVWNHFLEVVDAHTLSSVGQWGMYSAKAAKLSSPMMAGRQERHT